MSRAAILLCALLAARFIMAALLPLSADEAYYWLWSKHLAAGYFDHPPAIAFVIRAGTFLFGDTVLGVRVGGCVFSLAASWLVWRGGELVAPGTGWRACLIFNLTLMVAALAMAATPDAPSIAAAAAFLFCLAKLQQTEDGRWWLGAGAAAGLGLLAKYSAFFLGLGALLWLVLNVPARRFLWTVWPYLGGVIALAIFAPNLRWNESHGWATFAFQFGRIGAGHLTLRFLLEFIGAQIALATPFLFLLGVFGLAGARRNEKRFLPAALIWPALAYFIFHALRDRVQGNWPCFLYPAFAILAADAFAPAAAGAWGRLGRIAAAWGMPLAIALLVAAYAQSLFGILPLGRGDPSARLLGTGFSGVADRAEQLGEARHAGAIVTSDYETTAWLRFYLPAPALPVIQIGEDYRYPDAARPPAKLLSGPLLYFADSRRDRAASLARSPYLLEQLARRRNGVAVASYSIYYINGLENYPPARMP